MRCTLGHFVFFYFKHTLESFVLFLDGDASFQVAILSSCISFFALLFKGSDISVL